MVCKARAFSLIELLIVMAIASILLTIALPSYRDYVTRAHLGEAYDALATYRLQMEQSYLDNGNYGVNNCSIATNNTDSFNIACNLTNGGQGFTATATSTGANGVNGYTFTIDNEGNRATTAFPNAAVPTNCWLNKPGGC